MPNALLKSIANLDSRTALAHIAEEKVNLNANNEEGLCAIQLAAREGLKEVVLALLIADVRVDSRSAGLLMATPHQTEQTKKTSLRFAIEYQHDYLALILLACKADTINLEREFKEQPELLTQLDRLKAQSKETVILEEILFWAMRNLKEEKILKLINLILPFDENETLGIKKLPSEQHNLLAIIRLALSRKMSKVAFRLANHNNTWTDKECILTPAYWCLMNDPNIIESEFPPSVTAQKLKTEDESKTDKLNLKDEDWILLLNQLYATGEKKKADDLINKISQNNLQFKALYYSSPTINPNECKAQGLTARVYLEARLREKIEPLCDLKKEDELKNYNDAVRFSHQIKDLVALDVLFDCDKTIFKQLLLDRQDTIARFLLIENDAIVDSLMCSIQYDNPLFKNIQKLISPTFNPFTILSTEVIRFLSRQNPTLIMNTVLRAMKDRSPLDLNPCLTSVDLDKGKITINRFFPELQSYYMKRFFLQYQIEVEHLYPGYPISRIEKIFNNNNPAKKYSFIPLLNRSDINALQTVSHYFLTAVLNFKLNTLPHLKQWKKNNIISRKNDANNVVLNLARMDNERICLENPLIQSLIDIITEYQNTTHCFTGSKAYYWIILTLLMLTASILGLLITVPIRNNILMQMENIHFSYLKDMHMYYTNCANPPGLFDESSFCANGLKEHNATICSDICKIFLENELPFGFSVTGTLIAPLTFIGICIYLAGTQESRNQHFYEKQISQLPGKIYHEILRIKAQLLAIGSSLEIGDYFSATNLLANAQSLHQANKNRETEIRTLGIEPFETRIQILPDEDGFSVNNLEKALPAIKQPLFSSSDIRSDEAHDDLDEKEHNQDALETKKTSYKYLSATLGLMRSPSKSNAAQGESLLDAEFASSNGYVP